MDALGFRDTFTIRREAQGLRSGFVVSDGAVEAKFTRKQLLSWIHAAIDDDLGIRRDDGAAVTAKLVSITVKMEAIAPGAAAADRAMEKAKSYVDGLEVGDIFHGLRPAAEALGYVDPAGIEQRCFITFALEHLQGVIIYTDPDGRITRLERR